ncbi:PP2C family protein-serine/threonine phosphatase [Paraglaciecola arctica]|uniref:Protein phosphatase n=1 Tax=Paraglaciecola arctica BSs20135 TaxID=493475 RepID=K6YU71_9ALTE|nr:protein phosphatase 2C domain-containing protein [Paraglaciecola arctica]GAC21722.1 protein phosphatase [Paraglaciecola arctica BSs20135]
MLECTWKSVAKTDIGTIRKVNEDGFLDCPQVGMWCVADGMGGHAKGDVASKMIVDGLQNIANSNSYPLGTQQIKDVLQQVNSRLVSMASEKQAVIGSTVVVLVFDHQFAHCIWAGDSRIYRVRNNKLTRLTQDHSQVEELVQKGLLTPEEAERHPNANVITRAVGASDELDLDVVSDVRLDGDKYCLCSDGLNKVIDDVEIEQLLLNTPLDSIAPLLITTSLERKARDNVTVIVVDNQPSLEILDGNNTIPPNTLNLDDTLPLSR